MKIDVIWIALGLFGWAITGKKWFLWFGLLMAPSAEHSTGSLHVWFRNGIMQTWIWLGLLASVFILRLPWEGWGEQLGRAIGHRLTREEWE